MIKKTNIVDDILLEGFSEKIHDALYRIKQPTIWAKVFIKLLYKWKKEDIDDKLEMYTDVEVIKAINNPKSAIKRIFEYFPTIAYIPARGEIFINGTLLGQRWLITIVNRKDDWKITVYDIYKPIGTSTNIEPDAPSDMNNPDVKELKKIESAVKRVNDIKDPIKRTLGVYSIFKNKGNERATFTISKYELKNNIDKIAGIIEREEKRNKDYGRVLNSNENYKDVFEYNEKTGQITYLGDEWDKDIKKQEAWEEMTPVQRRKARKKMVKSATKKMKDRIKKIIKK